MGNINTRRTWRLCALLIVTSFAMSNGSLRGQSPPVPMVVYKTATCGCCKNWVEHVQRAGFEVKSHDVEDIAAVKSTYRVPSQLNSCHTALVGGYVIEGHVPADVIKRILRDRPKVAGVAVPGMPVGSPGMEMPGRSDTYQVVTFDGSGKTSVLETRR